MTTPVQKLVERIQEKFSDAVYGAYLKQNSGQLTTAIEVYWKNLQSGYPVAGGFRDELLYTPEFEKLAYGFKAEYDEIEYRTNEFYTRIRDSLAIAVIKETTLEFIAEKIRTSNLNLNGAQAELLATMAHGLVLQTAIAFVRENPGTQANGGVLHDLHKAAVQLINDAVTVISGVDRDYVKKLPMQQARKVEKLVELAKQLSVADVYKDLFLPK